MTAAVSQPETVELSIRGLREHEEHFVLDSWVKSYIGIAPRFGDDSWAWHRRVAKWSVATVPVHVLTLVEDVDTILGWCCGKPGLLHYVYVLHEARRNGLATELLQNALGAHPSDPKTRGTRITHRPPRQYRKLVNAVGWQWKPVTLQEIGQ